MKNEYVVHGDVTAVILRDRDGNRYEALIDTDDLALVDSFPLTWFRASRRHTVYAMGNYRRDGKCFPVLMHRLIVSDTTLEIDHINQNGLDNRRSNLRPATPTLNRLNSDRFCRPGRDGVRGVYRFRSKWRAQINVKGVHHHLGTFETKEAATIARKIAQERAIQREMGVIS
jgi:hypothetical protein